MQVLIVDNNSKYLNELKSLVSQFSPTVIGFSDIEIDNIQDYDLIILSGGSGLSIINHQDQFAKEIELIKHTTVPILGICLGFELIAYTFGAQLKRMESKTNNVIDIKPLTTDSVFAGLANIKVYESHRWVVTDAGDELMPLATSADGIEIIKHTNRLIYGFQFHPEMMPERTAGDELFANFIKIVHNTIV